MSAPVTAQSLARRTQRHPSHRSRLIELAGEKKKLKKTKMGVLAIVLLGAICGSQPLPRAAPSDDSGVSVSAFQALLRDLDVPTPRPSQSRALCAPRCALARSAGRAPGRRRSGTGAISRVRIWHSWQRGRACGGSRGGAAGTVDDGTAARREEGGQRRRGLADRRSRTGRGRTHTVWLCPVSRGADTSGRRREQPADLGRPHSARV